MSNGKKKTIKIIILIPESYNSNNGAKYYDEHERTLCLYIDE